eukprot:403346792
MKPLVQEQIFNPMSTEYGRVTKYLALDCEMDQGNFKNIPCKATVVNQRGEIVLDTLIFDEGQRVRSLQQIHGIPPEILESDVPTRVQVLQHLQHICSEFEKENLEKEDSRVVWVGHSVKYDLKCMGLGAVDFIDSALIEDEKQPPKLKQLVRMRLNAKIQVSIHSSVSLAITFIQYFKHNLVKIIDARASMALFMNEFETYSTKVQHLSLKDTQESVSKTRKKQIAQERKRLQREFLLNAQFDQNGLVTPEHLLSLENQQPQLSYLEMIGGIEDDKIYQVNLQDLRSVVFKICQSQFSSIVTEDLTFSLEDLIDDDEPQANQLSAQFAVETCSPTDLEEVVQEDLNEVEQMLSLATSQHLACDQ